MPTMNLTDLDVTAGSISFKVEVGEGGWELEDVDRPGEESGTVQLINVQTGAVIKTWTVNFNNGDTTFPSDGSSFSFTELSSDTPYRQDDIHTAHLVAVLLLQVLFRLVRPPAPVVH